MPTRRRFSLGFVSCLFILLSAALPARAQDADIGEILRSGSRDANLLLKEYLKPIGRGYGGNLNSAWFTRAQTHGKFGFDLTFNAGLAVVPDAARVMDLAGLDLQEVVCIDRQSNAIACPADSPTLAGEEEAGALIGSVETFQNPESGREERLFELNLPDGSGFPYVPNAVVQLSVGVPMDTDLSIRYMPPLGLEDVDVDLWGFGFKHGINQWLPGGGVLPVDLAIQAGYTSMKTRVDFDVTPEVDSNTYDPYQGNPSTWEGQRAEFKTSAWTVNALVGKKLPVVTLFGGVGYQSSRVSLGTPGSYPVVAPNDDFDPAQPQQGSNQPKIVEKIDEPVDIAYENNGGMRALAGLQVRIYFFRITASYTLSDYNVARVGLGFSFN